MNHATGLMSDAVTSHPSRMASKGIAPPPANGSSTRGARPPNAWRISSRSAATSGNPSRPQCRIPPTVSSFIRPSAPAFSSICPPIRRRNSRRPSSVPGSGSSVASRAARQAASGLRAGQMCSVEMCPCRTFFSCTESSDASRKGNAASISRREDTIRTSSYSACQIRSVSLD